MIDGIDEIFNSLTIDTKKELGQYYTTNYNYILQNFKIPTDVDTIIEPFAGNGDLLGFVKNNENKKYNLECYDIEPKQDYINKRDTLDDPPNYNGKYVITNPPYLARNKTKNKRIFDKYNVNDLYKCFLREIITNIAIGGIVIVPLNFFCSVRKNDIALRRNFFDTYDIQIINIFEEQVFSDTKYTVCSFQFIKKQNEKKAGKTIVYIYPSKQSFNTVFDESNHFMVGGEIYNIKKNNKYKITRLTKKNYHEKNTNIVVKCIDDANAFQKHRKIGSRVVGEHEVVVDNTPNSSNRTYATLVICPEINIDVQQILVDRFNQYITDKRVAYYSLFLANYRESTDTARKRIPFALVYNIVSYLLHCIENEKKLM